LVEADTIFTHDGRNGSSSHFNPATLSTGASFLNIRLRLSFSQSSIIAVTLLTLALGGTTDLWAQATIAALIGLLILVAPPELPLGRVPMVLFAALFVLALAAFLPADWSQLPAWRHHLVDDLHATLPNQRTPQPWITAQSCAVFFLGLVWASYLFSQSWNGEQRLLAARLLVVGIALLSAVAVVAFAWGIHIPGWNQTENRGWFPNRNQTADVLALSGIVCYALSLDRLGKGFASGWLWLIPLTIIGAALVVAYSRAGILLFFVGIVIWHLMPSRSRKSRKFTTMGLTAFFSLLALFLLFGGETLDRFHSRIDASASHEPDFRVAVQRDALQFSLETPILGVGLGNFEALFASTRQASINQDRAVHPESDFLWAACEMGWAAPLLLLAMIGWWMRTSFPNRGRSGESLRRALIVAVMMFVAHGFIDVSGHRLGSLFLALLFASFALPSIEHPIQKTNPTGFRILGMLLLGVSGWWFGSLADAPVPPTTASLAFLKGQIEAAAHKGDVATMEDLADRGLRITPLYWPFYYQRAYAEVYQPGKLSQATADFQVARALEPNLVSLCMDEGTVWLAVNQPARCVDAWEEAFRRAPPKVLEVFHTTLELGHSNPSVHADLLKWSVGNPDCMMMAFNYATSAEAKQMIADLLASDPDLHSLTSEQRGRFFDQWWIHGDQAELIAQLTAHTDWQNEGWPRLAQSYAQQNDFQHAWQLVDSHDTSAPVMPEAHSDESIPDLKHDFFGRPDNLGSGINLALIEIKQGQSEDALVTLRALEKIPDHPKYIFYLEAKQWAGRQQWEQAWDAWKTYAGL
jgi:O-antigen ligase